MLIPGLKRLRETAYSDRRSDTKVDPERQKQPVLDWYMQQYDHWRSLFEGSALEETLSVIQDPGTDSDHPNYRWPVRFNLIRSYCMLYAGSLWGRGKTGAEANDLFDIRVDPKVPGLKPLTELAPSLQDSLTYFWSYWFNILRALGAIQQWAGGCFVKVAWNPFSSTSVYGIDLQIIQPEHAYPVWNPINYQEVLAIKLKFSVSKAVAKECYGMTDKELEDYPGNDTVPVVETWDKRSYSIMLGKGKKGQDDIGTPAKIKDPDGKTILLMGDNPFKHPITGLGVIPITSPDCQRVVSLEGAWPMTWMACKKR
jgi:hypothetical protein